MPRLSVTPEIVQNRAEERDRRKANECYDSVRIEFFVWRGRAAGSLRIKKEELRIGKANALRPNPQGLTN